MTGRRSTRSLPSQPLRSRGVEAAVVGVISSGPGMSDGWWRAAAVWEASHSIVNVYR